MSVVVVCPVFERKLQNFVCDVAIAPPLSTPLIFVLIIILPAMVVDGVVHNSPWQWQWRVLIHTVLPSEIQERRNTFCRNSFAWCREKLGSFSSAS